MESANGSCRPPHFFLGPSNLDSTEALGFEAITSPDQPSTAVSETGSLEMSLLDDVGDPKNPTQQAPAARVFGYGAGPLEASDTHVAFGSIRLFRDLGAHQDSSWRMYSDNVVDIFPNENLNDLIRRGWLSVQQVYHASRPDLGVARIYLLPEDVDRASRASPKPFRKIIRWLIRNADISPNTWLGDFEAGSPSDTYGIPSAAQDESLFYIFNTLHSPTLDLDKFSGCSYAQSAMRDVTNATIPGIKTELYPYQRRSVASMLQREEDPARSQDARKPRYVDLQGNPFFMDVFDGVILRHSQLYVEPRGGILAETMGYGKTLVCVALILATRGFYPQVPEARLERSERLSYPQTPSLLSMAARAVRHKGLPWKAEFHSLARSGLHYARCLEELQKYEREFGEPLFHPTTPGRKASKRESERLLRLSNATLVVVPPNLIVQWQHEIQKHTEPGGLDVMVIDMATKTIPHWRRLMDQDIVLISKNRLEQEYRDDDLNQGKRFRGTDRVSSQLTELRWLRVVCDEGHSFASSASRTRTMAMLDKLSVERRWIISGTPSSSLIGVDVSLAVHETHQSRRRKSLDNALEQRRLPDSAKQEERDIDRLRVIVVNFLKVQPWANQKGADPANWKKYLAPFDSNGNRRCAPGLRPLLQSLMVRHRIKDIDVDITLPPLHNTTVYLEPSYYDKLALNLFILVLTANAVTSERTDEDYMHHPKNRKNLDLLISNLRQSTFHWVGFTEDQVKETIKSCDGYLDKHVDAISDEDGLLLTEAIVHAQQALADPGWRAFSKLHEIGVFVENFPQHASQAWSLHGEGGNPLLLGTLQAREAQKYIRNHLYEADPSSGLIGAGMRAMSDAHRRAEDDSQKPKKGSTGNTHNTNNTTTHPPGVSEEPRIRPTLPRPSTPSPRKRSASHLPLSPSSLPTSHALTQPLITGFTSSKLTYLCSRLLQLPPDTKSLIFYDSNNTAFWLAEALELLGLEFLIYSNTLPPATRAKYLSMFNTEPRWRVLLMDLKQASTGLHVASASRVWIVTPIWRREVEAQAVKRAHRIGQVSDVYVETLVLRGTIEERLWRRRKGVSEQELRRLAAAGTSSGAGAAGVQGMGSGGWLEDEGVVGIIKSATFLNVGDEERGDGTEQCCRLQTPVRLFVREEEEAVATGGQIDTLQQREAKRQKRLDMKKTSKGVRFADVPAVAQPPPPPVVTPLPLQPSSSSTVPHQSIFGGHAGYSPASSEPR